MKENSKQKNIHMKEDMQEVLHYDYFICYNIIGILSPPLRLFYLLQHHWHLFLIDRQEKVHRHRIRSK
jgi:hypothetical protein